MCNNGFHTIHHNRAGLHWSVLADVHAKECVGRMDARLDEPSMIGYLFRVFARGQRLAVKPGNEVADRVERREAAELLANVE